MQKDKTFNLATFFCLYIAQAIPMSFFSTAIPVMMRQENFSLSAIGLLQLIKLPWIFKFLWSPVVDRHTITVTDYKRWIIVSEFLYAILIFTVSLFDFHIDFYLIVGLSLFSFIASATQDIATDALAVVSFGREDKSMLNSMQSMGSFGGSMIGGGILLLLFKQIGWNNMLPFLSVFVMIILLPLLLNKRIRLQEEPSPKRIKASRKDLLLFFAQSGIGKQIGFLFLYYSGLIGILAMLKPYLVDLGYDMKEIGIMNGMVGTSIGFFASFAGGIIVRKTGRFRARILFALFILLSAVYFWGLSYVHPNIYQLYGGIFLLWGSYGMATIIVYTSAMDCVRPGREGTDFTMQTVITHLSSMLMAVFSGKVADWIGYRGLFAIETGIALFSLLYILTVFKKQKETI